MHSMNAHKKAKESIDRVTINERKRKKEKKKHHRHQTHTQKRKVNSIHELPQVP